MAIIDLYEKFTKEGNLFGESIRENFGIESENLSKRNCFFIS